MKTLILAAGYATRLYPLTKEYPKQLLPVGSRPIIEHIIGKLQGAPEIDEIIVVTNSKFLSLFKKWEAGFECSKRITIIDDMTKDHADRRGAIGDMRFVIDHCRITDDLLVVGGDNLFDAAINDFVRFAKTNRTHPVLGAYDIRDREHARGFGVVKVDERHRIVDFQEKPKLPRSTLVAMCLYYFPREKLSLIHEYLDHESSRHDAVGFYIEWLIKKEEVLAFVFGGRWFDIGHHEYYNEAKRQFRG